MLSFIKKRSRGEAAKLAPWAVRIWVFEKEDEQWQATPNRAEESGAYSPAFGSPKTMVPASVRPLLGPGP